MQKGKAMSVRRLVNNDYSFGNSQLDIISGIDECLQTCKTTLMQLAGEWFLDYRDGVRWGDVLAKKTDIKAMAELVKSTLLSVNGVTNADDITVDIDDRYAYIIARIDTNFGIINFNQSFNALEMIANDKTNQQRI